MTLIAARRAVSAVFFVDGAALGGWAGHIADAKHRLAMSDQQLGLVLLAAAGGAVTTMPLSAALIHRFGSRNVSVIAGLALCAVAPLLFVAPSVPAIVAALFLLGVVNGQMDVAMNAHSMAVQDRYDRPILSAIHGWFSVGGFAGGAGAALANAYHIDPLIHLSLASLVLLVVLLGSWRHLLPSHTDQGEGGSGLALPRGRLWLLGMLVLFAFVSEGAVWDWSSVFLRDHLRAQPWVASLGFGLASLGLASGRFLGDSWTARLGRSRLLLVSALVTAVGIFAAVSMPTPPLSIGGFALAGLGLANIVPLLFRAAAAYPGVSAGYGLAAVTTCGYSGFLGGPPLVGLAAERLGLSLALSSACILCLVIAANAKEAEAS